MSVKFTGKCIEREGYKFIFKAITDNIMCRAKTEIARDSDTNQQIIYDMVTDVVAGHTMSELALVSM